MVHADQSPPVLGVASPPEAHSRVIKSMCPVGRDTAEDQYVIVANLVDRQLGIPGAKWIDLGTFMR